MNRPDPTTTHRLTTAAVPEWAAEVAVGVPRMLAEIARLRAELSRERTFVDVARDQFIRTRESDLRVLSSRDDEIARIKRELDRVKAECCRLTCRNGDLEAEIARLRLVADLDAMLDRTADSSAVARLSRAARAVTAAHADDQSRTARLVRAARAVIASHEVGSLIAPIDELVSALAAMPEEDT